MVKKKKNKFFTPPSQLVTMGDVENFQLYHCTWWGLFGRYIVRQRSQVKKEKKKDH